MVPLLNTGTGKQFSAGHLAVWLPHQEEGVFEQILRCKWSHGPSEDVFEYHQGQFSLSIKFIKHIAPT